MVLGRPADERRRVADVGVFEPRHEPGGELGGKELGGQT
jgi:hypothetical protein